MTQPVRALLLLAALLGGCSSSPAPPVRTWDLSLPPAVLAITPAPDAPFLQFARVGAESWLQGLCIRRADGRFDTLVYERLVAPWPELVEIRLRPALLATGKFRAVLTDSHPVQRGWALLIHIARAEIDETGPEGVQAKIAYELSLLDPDGRLRSTVRIDAAERVEAGSVEALVRSLSAAVEAASLASARWVETEFAR